MSFKNLLTTALLGLTAIPGVLCQGGFIGSCLDQHLHSSDKQWFGARCLPGGNAAWNQAREAGINLNTCFRYERDGSRLVWSPNGWGLLHGACFMGKVDCTSGGQTPPTPSLVGTLYSVAVHAPPNGFWIQDIDLNGMISNNKGHLNCFGLDGP